MTVLSLLNPANWFGPSRAKLSGGPGNEDRRDVGMGNYANKPVTLDSALHLSAFWAAVKLTAQTIGTLPLVLYERQADGGRVAARAHPLYALLKDRPNADQTAVEFWEGMAAWMLLWGNAYAIIKRCGDGQITSLLPQRSDTATVRRDVTGGIRETVPNAVVKSGHEPDRLWHRGEVNDPERVDQRRVRQVLHASPLPPPYYTPN